MPPLPAYLCDVSSSISPLRHRKCVRTNAAPAKLCGCGDPSAGCGSVAGSGLLLAHAAPAWVCCIMCTWTCQVVARPPPSGSRRDAAWLDVLETCGCDVGVMEDAPPLRL